MCGILVVVNKAGGHLNLSACHRALSTLSWRGPDLCVSSNWNQRVFIGQTVLSLTGEIRDLSGSHTQSESQHYVVAFNGEIYNYRALLRRWLYEHRSLSTNTTDTQILVNLHDVLDVAVVPSKLDGMYAYCVLDKQKEILSVCRDVQGEKSLYVFENADMLIIASEISAIFSLVPMPSIDAQVLRDYFRTRHFMQLARTAYYGIRQILPGHLEQFDLKTMRWGATYVRSLKDWIDEGRMERNVKSSIDELADELDSLLMECIKDMLPDRQQYAAVVSGGVDSSLISHYLLKYGAPQLFVAVDHVGKDRISSNLSGFEQILGRSIEVIRVNPIQYAQEISRCQSVCGSPLPSHSFVAQSLLARAINLAGCRVVFGGEGGDEVFGGYETYLQDILYEPVLSPSLYTALSESDIEFHCNDSSLIEEELAQLWSEALSAYEFVGDVRSRVVLAMMYVDTAHQLASVGLRSADLMSMMWSMESRTVLVRKPILQFALSLPLQAKINTTSSDPNLRTKILLKRLFLRYYPVSLLVEKQGFAGFPNESAMYLGRLVDYLSFNFLGMELCAGEKNVYSKSTDWKLANIEYFLRRMAVK